MKKILMLALVAIFGIVLVGCDFGGNNNTTTTTTAAETTTAGQTTAATTAVTTTGSQTTTDSGTTTAQTTAGTTTEEVDFCETNPFAPSCITSDNIVLSYADWGDQELNQALIDSFMELYPNIDVVLRQDITGSGGAFMNNLVNAQAAGLLPDVFAVDSVPLAITNGMVMDVSEYWDMDPDTQYVYPNIQDSAVYNGQRFAIPSFQFIKGVFVNITLLETYNITIPDKDWTYDEFMALARQIRQLGAGDTVFGLETWDWGFDFKELFPTQDDANMGYNTWDGTQFNFTNQAWIDAFQEEIDFVDQQITVSLTPEQLEELGGPSFWPFYEGLVGFRIDGSWQLNIVDQMYDEKELEVGFWPYPGGADGQFPPTILDFASVSSQTDYPKEAYLLAKWMTFGKEGWNTRLDLMDERGDFYIDRFPVADYPEIWDRAEFYIDYIEGVRESVELLQYSKPDLNKWLPGYGAFFEWVANEENDYWTRIAAGEVTPDSFAQIWEDKINELVQAELAAIGTGDDEE